MMAGLLRRDAEKETALQQLHTLVDLNRRAMLDLMQAVLEELSGRKRRGGEPE